MPEFADIHSIYIPSKKLTDVEILRALKFGIASEFEAIQLYQQIMESTDKADVHKVLTDITDDEKRHAGALYKLLQVLSPEDEQQYRHGMQEAVENMNKQNSD